MSADYFDFSCGFPWMISGGKSFLCHVGHAFSFKSFTEAHADALERALWVALRKLNEQHSIQENLAQGGSGADRLKNGIVKMPKRQNRICDYCTRFWEDFRHDSAGLKTFSIFAFLYLHDPVGRSEWTHPIPPLWVQFCAASFCFLESFHQCGSNLLPYLKFLFSSCANNAEMKFLVM